VEVDVFPELRQQPLYLRSVSFREQLVIEYTDRAMTVFRANSLGPKDYLGIYKPYGNLLNNKAELELRNFLKDRHTLLAVKKSVVVMEMHIEFTVYSLPDVCRLMTFTVTICRRYDEIMNRLSETPPDTESLVQLQAYMRDVSNTLVFRLKDEVADAAERLNFLLDYAFLSADDIKLNSTLFYWPEHILNVLDVTSTRVNMLRETAEEDLKQRTASLEQRILSCWDRITLMRKREVISQEEMIKSVQILDEFSADLDALTLESEQVNKEEALVQWELTQFPQLVELRRQMEPFDRLWRTSLEFDACNRNWLQAPYHKLNPFDVEQQISDMYKTMHKLTKTLADLPGPAKVAQKMKTKLGKFQQFLPVIHLVCNPGIQPRHWDQMSDIVGFDIKPQPDTQLVTFLEYGLKNYLDQLEEVGAAAAKEHQLETTMAKMKEEWRLMHFELLPYRDTGISILSAIDDIQVLLDDHIIKAQTMRNSPYIKPFEKEMIAWETKLISMNDILDVWLKVQATWLYLEPIFSSEDILAQMPEEGRKFGVVDVLWREVMNEAAVNPSCLVATDQRDMLRRLTDAHILLEEIQKGLNDYLEKKRLYFPRFFFLSNDELLEILSETKDPQRVQPHLKKCFEGISRLSFTEQQEIVGMTSAENETVPFVTKIYPAKAKGMVEKWLLQVEDVMLSSLRKVISDSVYAYSETPREKWVLDWPGQVVLCVSCIYWTEEVQEAMSKNTLANYKAKCDKQIDETVRLVRGPLTSGERITLGALIVVDVHARDVVAQMVEHDIRAIQAFEWLSQLRYYFDSDDATKVTVCQITTELDYGYEYLGNTPRLVITPLTDRCYRTLMGALKLNLGGAPEGPAGTGKTETSKDLAKAVAKQCVVFNCSDGLDYRAMSKFFKGLAQSGAWACFDEFNRIELEVLSVVAQQIFCIQSAISAGLKRFVFEGTELSLNPTCTMFITMNPGYAGRQELPDNLKVLFRSVAMMVPDYALIGEISLYSMGFIDARSLASKIVATYRLCSEQLSSQHHYDYGMRAVKSVLTAAGNLRQKYLDEDESVLLLKAINDVNLPKFLSQDIPLFEGIISDLFPAVSLPKGDYDQFLNVMKTRLDERQLQAVPWYTDKIMQIYEMIQVRHGLMIVGDPLGGKTQGYQTLADTLTQIAEIGMIPEESAVHYGVINPKAITMGQLYGQFDLVSHEWSDGILAVLFREFAVAQDNKRRWILFDGPVDAVWIENMNTVLDDNKKLCLMSGEIIQMSPHMNLIFEPADLEQASPATVSRCGMIYMEPAQLGWRPMVKSYIDYKLPSSLSEELLELINDLFEWLVDPTLSFIRSDCRQMFRVSHFHAVRQLIVLFDCLLDEIRVWADTEDGAQNVEGTNPQQTMTSQTVYLQLQALFLFATVWSLGSVLPTDSRVKFDSYFRDLVSGTNSEHPKPKTIKLTKSNSFPERMTVYDFWFDKRSAGSWQDWSQFILPSMEKTALPEVTEVEPNAPAGGTTSPPPTDVDTGAMIVTTVDTARMNYFLNLYITHQIPLLLVGPTGTGKTAIANSYLIGLPKDQYIPNTLNFSARTSANQTQDIIMSRLDRRRKGVFGPPPGKQCVVFVDDLNMPMKEKYGAQPPIELLRMWLDHGHWYDRKDNTKQILADVRFMAAMGPPGGGRNDITSRLTRHLNILGVNEFDDNTMSRIFTTIVDAHFSKRFEPQFQRLGKVYRVFYDRLTSTEDESRFFEIVRQTCSDSFRTNLDKVLGHLSLSGRVSDEDVRGLMFGNYMQDDNVYDEVTDAKQLTARMEGYLDDYNALSKTPMNMVMFKFAMEHISRVSRVLQQESGHALLVGVGGSGRQSATRLATHINDHELFVIEITRNYGINEWRDDLKRLLIKTGCEGRSTVFLISDSQIKQESFMEDISMLLNSGDVPNLFPPDEKAEVIDKIQVHARNEGRKIDSTPLAMYSYFTERVRKHLHIVIATSPIGDSFRARLRMFPSLINCCTIDWFHVWPEDALEMVANKYFEEIEFAENTRESCVYICKYFHESVRKLSDKFLDVVRRHSYVTPTSYLEMILTFKKLLTKKRTELTTMRNRYLTGLQKLEFAAGEVGKMQIELKNLQPLLMETSAETDVLLRKIAQDSVEVEAQREIVAADQLVANQAAAVSKAIKDECEADLAEAMPILKDALASLDTLKQSDITLVKSMKNPPNVVKLVMEAVCIMLGEKPDRRPDGTGRMTEDYWGPSLKLLGDLKFLDRLRNYNIDHIPTPVMKKIRDNYIPNTDFDPKIVRNASTACEGLCKWIIALDKYDTVARIVAPKKEKLAVAEAELEVQMAKLAEKKAALDEVQAKFQTLQDQLDEMQTKKQDLEDNIELCSKKLDRAEKLINGLGGEKNRWTEAAAMLKNRHHNIIGDVLLSAGVVAYLGPFTVDFRSGIQQEWHELCVKHEVPCSDVFRISDTLGDPVKIRSWNIAGLPVDSFSIDNGIIVTNSDRWSLCIDPQGQANKWIKNMERENKLSVVKMSDTNYLRTLENAVQFGMPVLMENVGEQLDPILEPILQRLIFKSQGVFYMRLGDSVIEYNPDFRFYITTRLRNPHYLPEVSVKVCLINFMITPLGLEDQLLGIVTAEEKPELEATKNELIVTSADNKRQLKELEDKILEVLSASQGNILENETAINVLSSSKKLSEEITEKQIIAESTQLEIDEARNGYRPVAAHGSLLFFCISELSNIDPMYQYSLTWFINLFLASISNSEKSQVLEERIEILNNYFTKSVYRNICRSLFENHKLLFSLVMCYSLLKNKNKVNEDVWRFLLTGGVALDNPHANPAPDWLSDKCWAEIVRASDLPGLEDFMKDVKENTTTWKQMYDSMQPHKFAAPGKLSGLVGLEKLVVLRCIRPDKVIPGIQDFIVENMGTHFIEPPTFDLAGSFTDSNNCSPLIFVLSPGADPMNALIKFGADMGYTGDRIQTISLGQGQGPIAANMITQGIEDGTWIVLQNCHLAVSWMSALEKICEEIITPTKTHHDFRLWLTSYPSKDFPVTILENGVKMTNEPPKGLRSNLLRSYLNDPISDPAFFSGCSKGGTWRKMLFGLCFFHALVQERRKFGPLGWNVPYEFNESDLRISVRQMQMFLDQYDELPLDALTYLTGECNYGGRVTDDKDRRLLISLLGIFYNREIIEEEKYKLSPSGIYYCPPDGTHQDFVDYIRSLPINPLPEVYGLHDNADITKDNQETVQLFAGILLTLPRQIGGTGKSPEATVLDLAADILSKLPPDFNLKEVIQRYPVVYKESMNTVLRQELIRFNRLTAVVRSTLIDLQKAIKGLVVMSADLEDVFNSMLVGKLPSVWAAKSFPSLKPLGSYFQDLILRLKFFADWLTYDAPPVFWLSGFYFTQSFLTGILQNYARKHTIPIDTLGFSFTVTNQYFSHMMLLENASTVPEYTPMPPAAAMTKRQSNANIFLTQASKPRPPEQFGEFTKPPDGAYVSGLFLEGARWDPEKDQLAESRPKVLFDTIPVIWLKPSKLADIDVQGTYACPVYKTSARRGVLSTTGHSTNFVQYIQLKSGLSEQHWINRGVAALCQLDD
ncbi:dynein heavy chain, axonemal, partial [Paragonimus westermani]